MKLIEHTYGLFPHKYFVFPNGNFNINISNCNYKIECRTVAVLRRDSFEGIEELSSFFSKIEDMKEEFVNSIPSIEKEELIFYLEFFENILSKLYSKDDSAKKTIIRLAQINCYLDVMQEHEFEESNIDKIEYINKLRDEEGIKKAKKIFFNTAKKFHEYVLVLRAPYEKLLDISYLNMNGVRGFFCLEDGIRITKVRRFLFDHFSPYTKEIEPQIQTFLDKKMDMPLEDIFIAKAKTYLRLNNYAMAIIHAVIALEVIVPRYINGYLKMNDINKQAIEDFNNKFGLSVRVKALLKLMLPSTYHDLIPNVGSAIKHRNKIMHEGIGNDSLEKIDNMKDIIADCEGLVNALKIVGKEKGIFIDK
ncbi:hypothetical protein [Clostridium beijerinckii]|uniref:hypothetical protein n=1 Tax=Clostridium beijerinckii TaxID=1520 RepID=UPI00156F6D93|nr:hypothetical protein [Clostridium beijerinckii]NRT70025.1 uncharacterized protein YsxB (DUF464 family) [Clostridium beijerinckii]